jgi:hypothetical protein
MRGGPTKRALRTHYTLRVRRRRSSERAARQVGASGLVRRDGRTPPLRSWDNCSRIGKLLRPIAPPKGVGSVLEHFPSNQLHRIPPTCGYPKGCYANANHWAHLIFLSKVNIFYGTQSQDKE